MCRQEYETNTVFWLAKLISGLLSLFPHKTFLTAIILALFNTVFFGQGQSHGQWKKGPIFNYLDFMFGQSSILIYSR